MPVLLGILVALHGLITLAIGGTAASGAPTPEMSKLPGAGWYPVALGDSWLLRGGAAQIGGVLWVLAGVGLLLTAASIFGFILPAGAWRQIALASGALGLAGIALFFHPYYVVAIVANLALIAAATVLEPTARRLLGM
jgi:hypothetical protein